MYNRKGPWEVIFSIMAFFLEYIFMQLCYIMYTSVVEALLSEQHYQLIDHLA